MPASTPATLQSARAEGWLRENPTEFCMCGCGEKAPIATKTSKAQGNLKGHIMQYCRGHGQRCVVPESMPINVSGLCQCHPDCQEETTIATKSNFSRNIIAGYPRWYARNHRPQTPDNRETLTTYIQQCETCGELKPLRRFRKDKTQPLGRVAICKDCLPQTETTTAGDQLMRMYITRMRNKKFLHEYVLQHACVQCGEADPVVLHFHHRDPSTKKDTVARLVHNSSSIDRIMTEIEKCDLLCANCHIKHHAPDQEWSKSSDDFYIDLPPEFHYLYQTVSEDRREVIRLVG